MTVPEAAQRPGIVRRIIAFPLTLLLIGAVMLVLAVSGVSAGLHALDIPRNSPLLLPVGLAIAGAGVLAYKAFKRWVERAGDGELPLNGAVGEVALGLLGGFIVFSAAVAVVARLGGFELLGVRGLGQLWTMLLMAIVSGTWEEILFRGLMLRQIEALLGTWAALGITSAFFGLAHLFNPDSSLFAAFAIAVEAGIMLGAAYLLTRRLWLAIGLHAGWNFTQGWVYSIPVSGGEVPLGLLITRRVGPDWLTGGDFGLEASAVALAVATVAGGLLLWLAWRKGGFIGPVWARQTKL